MPALRFYLLLDIFLGAFGFLFDEFVARTDEIFQFGHKFGNVFKFEIDRSETDISDLIEFFQTAS